MPKSATCQHYAALLRQSIPLLPARPHNNITILPSTQQEFGLVDSLHAKDDLVESISTETHQDKCVFGLGVLQVKLPQLLAQYIPGNLSLFGIQVIALSASIYRANSCLS
ncbi:MAG: hypothetical protein M1485_02320 [Chloroflexi bacterium]|nr:hypothetical protein [Chloroflexota bacterium]